MVKKKMGRPPKPPDEVASERIDMRVTPAEKASFEAAAQLSGSGMSEWMRQRLRKAAERELRK